MTIVVRPARCRRKVRRCTTAPDGGSVGECSVSVNEVRGELRVELAGDGAATGAAVAVGLAWVLDPQQHLGASAHLVGGAQLHAVRVAPLVVVGAVGVAASVDDEWLLEAFPVTFQL